MNQISPQTIGAAMRSCRKKHRMSIRALSVAAYVPYSSIARAEKGEACLHILSLVPCALVLGVTLDEYIGLNTEKGGMISID